ncbi:MAG: hypothetical protein K0S32_2036 [Bacteroidetes bacterium]|jgi:uncharacterized protein YkwD/outer membrane protein OmpA-like peptidoglycan-associated protein|nr:hypothetical protein [Bacteroidota bacterium]
MKQILPLIFLLSSFIGFSQKSSPEINLSNINYNLIESEFMERLNKLRAEKNLSLLTSDNTLKKAAKDQADYQNKKHYLTHTQPDNKIKETPQKRVFFYNGTHDQVGENCIMIPVKKVYKAKYKKEVEVKTYSDAGEALFLGWKNSPGHYANMITPGYDVSGLGFSFDKDSSKLYCAQVFGAKPFIPTKEFQSPADAYGVKDEFEPVCKILQTSEGRRAIKSFDFVIKKDSIYLRSEDLPTLTKFFTNAGDGIYFDLVQRTQFVCEKNNLLHGSPVYDGKMLAPIYFKDVLKRNHVRDGRNLYAAACATPKKIDDKNISLSYGIIKNGFSCEYTYLIEVPEQNLEMLALYPKWIYTRDLQVQPDSFNGFLSFTIPFERGQVILSEKKKKQLSQKLEIYKPFITDVKLQTFSSIEGSTQTNLKLQEQRAANISDLIKNYTPAHVTINTQSVENWDEFFLLIENTPVAYLKNLPKEKIKERLKSKLLLDSLDYLLKNSRSAQLNVKLKAFVDNNSGPYLLLAAYKKSIETGDSLKAFTYQNKILEYITKYEFVRGDLLPVEIPLTKKFLPHLTNYLAVAVKDDELVYSHEARELAIKASQIDSTYLPIKFNKCIMAIRYLQDFQDTIYPLNQLEKEMQECFKMKSAEDSVITNHMFMNYHILSLYRNWSYHFYHNIDKHLNGIKKYYPGAQISQYEAIQLALLFNLYARYDWSYELLLPYVRNKTKDQDLLFLFVETCASFRKMPLPEAEWEKYVKKVKNMNRPRFDKWISEDNFQLLRNDLIKREFCGKEL